MNIEPNKLGSRFDPHWDRFSGKQVTGLINLIEYVAGSKDQIWCEIGSNIGESALLISSFSFVKTLYCIDPLWSEEQKNQFKKRLSHIQDKIKHIAKISSECFNDFDYNIFDVIYIDGNHSYEYVIKDIDFAMKTVKRNGFICGHDYSENHLGVKNAVDDLIKKYDFKINTFCDSSFAIKKVY